MSHLFLPSDPRSSGSRRRSRRSATTRSSLEPEGEALAERGERARAAASRSARSGRAPAATTTCCRRPQPGDALQLFAEPRPPPPRAALGGVHRDDDRAPRPPSRPAGETALRDARAPARRAPRAGRRDLAPHRRGAPRDQRARQPRRRRAARSTKATDEQLEKGNRAARARGRAPRSLAPWTRCPSGPTAPSRCSSTARRGAARDPGVADRCAPARARSSSASRPRRESLARLRADPRCALTILAAGDLAFTAHGRAVAFEETEHVVAVRIDGRRDRRTTTARPSRSTDGVQWRWTDEAERERATPQRPRGAARLCS